MPVPDPRVGVPCNTVANAARRPAARFHSHAAAAEAGCRRVCRRPEDCYKAGPHGVAAVCCLRRRHTVCPVRAYFAAHRHHSEVACSGTVCRRPVAVGSDRACRHPVVVCPAADGSAVHRRAACHCTAYRYMACRSSVGHRRVRRLSAYRYMDVRRPDPVCRPVVVPDPVCHPADAVYQNPPDAARMSAAGRSGDAVAAGHSMTVSAADGNPVAAAADSSHVARRDVVRRSLPTVPALLPIYPRSGYAALRPLSTPATCPAPAHSGEPVRFEAAPSGSRDALRCRAYA